jgi:hypothetical protein
MVEVEQVKQKTAQLEKELASVSSDIICRFPVEDYLNDVKSCRRFRGYCSFFSRKRKRVFEKIISDYGLPALSLYHKLALSLFIKDSLERLTKENLPNEILQLYYEWFERVLEDFSTQPDDYYNHDITSFQMDVGVCALRIIPVGGAWTVHICRIELGPFVSGGAGQFFDYLKFILFKTHGFTPFCVIHTFPRYLRHFNEKEMDLSYLRIAKLMRRNPRIKGFYRRSWFLDPKLDDISPNLGYLRQIPLQNGAKMFSGGSKKSDIDNSLAMSPLRRKLYKQGKYLPTGYAYIWPRKDFLEWADKTDIHFR